MIILNGKCFAKRPIQGATGTYSVTKKAIYIKDLFGNRVGVINAYGVLGSASKLENGKCWYTYVTPSLIGDYPFAQQIKEAENALAYVGIEKRV